MTGGGGGLTGEIGAAYSVGMPAIIIKVTREGHRQVKRDAKKKHRGVISEYVRDRLGLGIERGEARESSGNAGNSTKREA